MATRKNGTTGRTKRSASGAKDATVVSCPESIDITAVAEFYGQLRAAFDLGKPITLDAASVERADGAGIQLLCVCAKAAGEGGLGFQWKNVPEPLRSAGRRLGLASQLGFD